MCPTALAVTRSSAVVDFVKSTQTSGSVYTATYAETGGSDSLTARVDTSHLAAHILVDLFDQTLEGDDNFKNWILNQQLTNGSFWNIEGGTVSVYASYHAVQAMDVIDEITAVASELTTFLDLCKVTVSATKLGWANQPSGPVSLISTAQALETYYTYQGNLSQFTTSVKDQVAAFTLACQNVDGGFGDNETSPSSLEATHAALQILSRLVTPSGSDQLIYDYVMAFKATNANYTGRVGGFTDGTNPYPSLSQTYHASKILEFLGNTTDSDGYTQAWILNRQNLADGGFVDRCETDLDLKSNIFSTFYALEALQVYDDDLSGLKGAEWDLEFDWVPLVIIIVVLACGIALIVVVWRRRRI